MLNEIRPLIDLYQPFTLKSLVAIADILLVAFLIYRLFALIKGTRAWRILAGVGIFVAMLFLSKALNLSALYWLLEKATILGPVALVILLLPELRQAVEGFGRFGVWTQWLVTGQERTYEIQARTVEEIIAAVSEMSQARIGALLVLERAAQADDIINSGVRLDAKVSAPLLVSIFYEGNPLHDGAVIIRGETLVAAACRLPLSDSRLDPSLHMRHRAAVGVTEQVDSIALVVSEERGTVGVAVEGGLRRFENLSDLRDFLNQEWRGVGPKADERPKIALFAKGGRK